MQRTIRKVAVLGSGVMGSAIAAHFTNVGLPCLLLDIPAPEGDNPNAISLKGLENISKAKPAAFYSKKSIPLITVGNFNDDLAALEDCDLVVSSDRENGH